VSRIKTALRGILGRARGVEVIGLRTRPGYGGERERFAYQSKLHRFDIGPDDEVLDVGSGADPFPYATMLVDLHRGTTEHRREALATAGKPFKVADINQLPFDAKSFGFVYCSHVLEHVENPKRACEELMRVGKRGYVETPSLMSDVLFAWAAGMHRWHVVAIANRLVFFEYGARLAQGVRSEYWRRSIFSRSHHPLQDVFYRNLDIFNSSLMWRDCFNYTVFHLDGKIEQSDFSAEKIPGE
jgi:SAM-dependent methyltransferase